MDYVGRARLHDAGVKVKFTGAYYKINDGDIDLGETSLDFGTLYLTDTITGGVATLKGNIYHQSWKNMFFDLEANINGKPITLLDVTAGENSAFYGRFAF